jgi:LmbE family N-acetylglucosaminyl deacetylase
MLANETVHAGDPATHLRLYFYRNLDLMAPVYNLVFVVCHPDDETIWAGGLLYELSRFPELRCHVICLSGHDASSPREQEFQAARAIASYASGVVMGGPLRGANDPLPDLGDVVEQGLGRLGLSAKDVSLVVTHSPFGDEQMHPHHRQSFRQVQAWSKRRGRPFGCFSCVPMPFYYHLSLLDRPKRRDTFQVVQYCRVSPARTLASRVLDLKFFGELRCPRYYLQFASDVAIKTRMLECYASIDVPSHMVTYLSSTNPCEALYLYDEAALEPFRGMLDAMTRRENPNLFEYASYRKRIPAFLRRKVFQR